MRSKSRPEPEYWESFQRKIHEDENRNKSQTKHPTHPPASLFLLFRGRSSLFQNKNIHWLFTEITRKSLLIKIRKFDIRDSSQLFYSSPTEVAQSVFHIHHRTAVHVCVHPCMSLQRIKETLKNNSWGKKKK